MYKYREQISIPMEFEIEKSSDKEEITNSYNLTKIDVIRDGQISYNDFFSTYIMRNVPCIIQGVTEKWEAHKLWLKESKPNLEYLKVHYGPSEVTIYDCNERFFNSHKTQTWKFNDYLDKCWSTNGEGCKYLKDWHLKNEFSDDFYEVPIYFASDWLNEFLTESVQDDYRFVYMGPAGTWTPFHADVFTSYSWSANVCGRKKWVLFPPGEEHKLNDEHNSLMYDISNLYEARETRHFEIIQNSGEAIFVPSGWHHQVWNLEDTISVNHNWINGCNINRLWISMVDHLNSVKREIEDCSDMEDFIQHCQVVLKASFGMDFVGFYNFIKFIASNRMSVLSNNVGDTDLFHGHKIGRLHSLFDLKAVHVVLEKFVSHSDLFVIDDNVVDVSPTSFLWDVSQFVKKVENTNVDSFCTTLF